MRLLVLVACGVALAGPARADVQRFEAYLAANHPGRTWDSGPSRIDGAAVRAAYGTALEFYMVHSSPPLPPGAPQPDALRAHDEALQRHLREKVSLVVSVDRKGTVRPVRTPADVRRGLKLARTAGDRRLVAAAVASITAGTFMAPGELTVDEVELTRDGDAWVGTAKRMHARMVSVWFDARGRVVRVNAGDLVQMPPSSPPRR